MVTRGGGGGGGILPYMANTGNVPLDRALSPEKNLATLDTN